MFGAVVKKVLSHMHSKLEYLGLSLALLLFPASFQYTPWEAAVKAEVTESLPSTRDVTDPLLLDIKGASLRECYRLHSAYYQRASWV